MGHAFSFLGPRRSPSSDTSAAILPDGNRISTPHFMYVSVTETLGYLRADSRT